MSQKLRYWTALVSVRIIFFIVGGGRGNYPPPHKKLKKVIKNCKWTIKMDWQRPRRLNYSGWARSQSDGKYRRAISWQQKLDATGLLIRAKKYFGGVAVAKKIRDLDPQRSGLRSVPFVAKPPTQAKPTPVQRPPKKHGQIGDECGMAREARGETCWPETNKKTPEEKKMRIRGSPGSNSSVNFSRKYNIWHRPHRKWEHTHKKRFGWN